MGDVFSSCGKKGIVALQARSALDHSLCGIAYHFALRSVKGIITGVYYGADAGFQL